MRSGCYHWAHGRSMWSTSPARMTGRHWIRSTKAQMIFLIHMANSKLTPPASQWWHSVQMKYISGRQLHFYSVVIDCQRNCMIFLNDLIDPGCRFNSSWFISFGHPGDSLQPRPKSLIMIQCTHIQFNKFNLKISKRICHIHRKLGSTL